MIPTLAMGSKRFIEWFSRLGKPPMRVLLHSARGGGYMQDGDAPAVAVVATGWLAT